MPTLLSLVWALVVQAPDSAATASLARVLKAVDDSLSNVRGVAANVRTDLSAASPALVRSRAARMSGRCEGARAALVQLESALVAVYSARAAAAQRTLRGEAGQLTRTLERCAREWDATRPGADPDSLRAWGPHRLDLLEQQIRRYAERARVFRARAGIK